MGFTDAGEKSSTVLERGNSHMTGKGLPLS